MSENMKEAEEKILRFFDQGILYFGKEIHLGSNQNFQIEQIVSGESLQPGRSYYHMQYGYPQSGCVSIKFDYFEKEGFSLTDISVDAPPADKEMTLATFAPQFTDGEVSVGINFGLDNGTVEHNDVASIAANPNALKMLKFAADDLEQAEVLGECRQMTPVGSELIPCTNSTNRPQYTEENGNAK